MVTSYLYFLCLGVGDLCRDTLRPWRVQSTMYPLCHIKKFIVIPITYPLPLPPFHTAKTQYRKLETNIPRRGIERPQSQFPQQNRQTDCENISTAHRNMWKLGLRSAQFLFWEYINGIFVAVQCLFLSTNNTIVGMHSIRIGLYLPPYAPLYIACSYL
jgi:hypothetical protein